MNDIVDHANMQMQQALDDAMSRSYSKPANDIHDCITCDKPIGIHRKAAIPFATRCIDCQTRIERKR